VDWFVLVVIVQYAFQLRMVSVRRSTSMGYTYKNQSTQSSKIFFFPLQSIQTK